MRAALIIVGCVIVSGCEDYACTLSVERSVIVDVFDAETGAPAAAASRGFIRQGAFRDTLEAYSGRGDGTLTSLAAGWERAGIYNVHIENPAYQSWDTTGVVVRSGQCHVRTARIAARLRRP